MPTALNIVRFRVKPGMEQEFIEAHRKLTAPFKGFLGGHLVKTGENTFAFVGQWRGFDYLAGARPQMSALLDSFRHLLEDLGSGLGVTDPVSGDSVVTLPGPKPKAKPKRAAKKAAPRKRPATKKARAKPAKRARK